ncbi:MAG: type II toxin-antitoxin system Phd/YefM family antitoxin [Proteobacteria bacterium]|nr:type II toxin-antitoxin system Phd/YefM family antitoxin [Pseudomonadota bacterium]
MKLSVAIKPISYFKAHAAEIIRNLSENQETMIITQNGEAKAIVQDIRKYEETQESLVLLRILAKSRKNIEQGKFRPARDVLGDLKKKIKEDFPA